MYKEGYQLSLTLDLCTNVGLFNKLLLLKRLCNRKGLEDAQVVRGGMTGGGRAAT